MARDYAKKTASKGTKKPAKSAKSTSAKSTRGGASNNNGGRQTPENQELPRWGWFTVGFLFGIFAAFLFYLALMVPADPESQPSAKPIAKVKPVEEEELKLEFYTLFPKQEVPIDTVDETDSARQPIKVPDNARFALQAGSFRNRDDADRLRGQIILLGLKGHIESIKDKNATTWHRVILGPMDTKLDVMRAKTRLAEDDIQSIVLRVK